MKISRRRLLELSLFNISVAAFSNRSQAFVTAPRQSPSILQGATDESKTQFSVVHSANEAYDFKVENSSGHIWTPDFTEQHSYPGQTDVITKAYFSNLYLNETFTLSLETQDAGTVIDRREFKMLDTQNESLSFAVCSCMDDSKHSPEIWDDLVSRNPDFIIFAGDSTYCDMGYSHFNGAARLWDRFAQARRVLQIYFSSRLIPIFSTWDDHDFGKNDTGKEYSFAKESLRNFLQFFAMDADYCSALERGPGVSSAFVLGGQQFLLMDNRSFRTSGHSNDRYAHWGKEQEEWLLSRISNHPQMSWIINGSQMFPQMFFKESFSSEHPIQFHAIRRALAAMPGKVAFVSGDVHFSEISKIESEALGYLTYEFTSSSMHSHNFPGTPGLIWNSRRMAATGERNYMLFTSKKNGAGCNLTVESRSAGQRINFKYQLSV